MRFSAVFLLGLVSATYGLPKPGLPHFDTPPNKDPVKGSKRVESFTVAYEQNGSYKPVSPEFESKLGTNTREDAQEWTGDVVRRIFGSMGLQSPEYKSYGGKFEGDARDWEFHLTNFQVVLLKKDNKWSVVSSDKAKTMTGDNIVKVPGTSMVNVVADLRKLRGVVDFLGRQRSGKDAEMVKKFQDVDDSFRHNQLNSIRPWLPETPWHQRVQNYPNFCHAKKKWSTAISNDAPQFPGKPHNDRILAHVDPEGRTHLLLARLTHRGDDWKDEFEGSAWTVDGVKNIRIVCKASMSEVTNTERIQYRMDFLVTAGLTYNPITLPDSSNIITTPFQLTFRPALCYQLERRSPTSLVKTFGHRSRSPRAFSTANIGRDVIPHVKATGQSTTQAVLRVQLSGP
ncbi:hypothetical protein EV360DRAFT_75937 [Lentinula raphanica]|nr:hypothetical protein EV360DRAFT_75937 [Lentinula raphanica]